VEFRCPCKFWSSRQQFAEVSVFVTPEAGWDFRYGKETLLGLHQIFWRQAEGNRNSTPPQDLKLVIERPNRLGLRKLGATSD